MWERAILNMPITRTYTKWPEAYCHIVIKRGQQANLARCLGYFSHQSVYCSWGCKPRGKRAVALQKLAGPYGAILAKIKLRDPNTKLGFKKSGFRRVQMGTYAQSRNWETYKTHNYLQWRQVERIKTVIIDGHCYLRFGYHTKT